MSEAIWTGIVAAAALAGSGLTYWQGMKSIERQLAHAERMKRHDALRDAYEGLLAEGYLLASSPFNDKARSDALSLPDKLEALMLASSRASLVAPRSTQILIDDYVDAILASIQNPEKEGISDALANARIALVRAARHDIDTDSTPEPNRGLPALAGQAPASRQAETPSRA
jgi:hypothetical protein